MTTALLAICLIMVLTPQRARIETRVFAALETGKAVVLGSVHNAQGEAIAGVEIRVVGASRGAPIAEASTQPNGRYVIALPSGLPEQFSVEISRGHYRKAAIALTPTDIASLRGGLAVVLPPTVLARSLGPAFWITTLIFLTVLGLMASGRRHNTLAALMGVATLFVVSYLGGAVREDLFIFDFRSALLYVDWSVIS